LGFDMKIPRELTEYVRVLKLASTPTTDEFTSIAGISAMGVSLIGFLGFAVFVAMGLLPT